jgi:hypothetical protein
MATRAFNPKLYALVRAQPRVLAAGTDLFHSHRSDPDTGQFPFNAFNPYSDTRFAGVLATPRRAGYYAGTTAACALWESDLRHVVGDELGQVTLHPALVKQRRMSVVRTTRPLTILDLFPSTLAGMASRKTVQHRWTKLTTTDNHRATHAPAAHLLAELASQGLSVDGFAWFSRQCGTATEHPVVYAFFAPPATSGDFEELPHRPSFLLDSPEGWAAIDEALSIAGLKRALSGGDVGARLAPPSPEDEP